MIEQVILVDENDKPIGQMEKMQAHWEGKLHRAFSVFIFNSENELLLQQRALSKYHSGGLWTNTCCSHPRMGESNDEAANRRLNEEMGMICSLTYGFNFIYKSEFSDGLIEHELDHVFFGNSDQLPEINKEEVESYKYMNLMALKEDIEQNPQFYTPWLKICLERVIESQNLIK